MEPWTILYVRGMWCSSLNEYLHVSAMNINLKTKDSLIVIYNSRKFIRCNKVLALNQNSETEYVYVDTNNDMSHAHYYCS